jgi:hypothetical protein
MTNVQRNVAPGPASPRSRLPTVVIILLAGSLALLIVVAFLVSLEIGLRHHDSRPAPSPATVTTSVTMSVAAPAPITLVPTSSGAVPPPTGTPGGSPSKGIIAAHGAATDVAIGPAQVVGSTAEVPVFITNHSSHTSSYVVQLALDAADGVTQLDTCAVFVRDVHSGQEITKIGVFIGRKTLPPGSSAAVKSVQRLAD